MNLYGLLTMFLLSLTSFALQAQVKWIDLSGDLSGDGSPYRQDGTTEPKLFYRLDLEYLDSKTLALGFDHFSNCTDNAARNQYNILLIDVPSGRVKLRKTFTALPKQLQLLVSPLAGPLLISTHQIQVLNRDSLEVERSVELPRALPATGLDANNCSIENLRVSSTPDGQRIELQTAIWLGTDAPVYDVDGLTLKVVEKQSHPFAEFATDYTGIYIKDRRTSWTRLDQNVTTNVCDQCSSVHVVRRDVIAIDYGGQIKVVQRQGGRAWRASYRGMADDVSVDRSGNSMAILSTFGGGPLWARFTDYLTVLNVTTNRVVLRQAIHPPTAHESPNLASSVLAASPSGDAYAVLMGKSVGVFKIKD